MYYMNPKYKNVFMLPEKGFETVDDPTSPKLNDEELVPGGNSETEPITDTETAPADGGKAESATDRRDQAAGFQPKTRREHFIAKLAGNPNAKDLDPKARWEYFMAKIAGNQKAASIHPMTRSEILMNEFAPASAGDPVIYGFRVDSSVEGSSSDCVTYLESAVGMEPAAMDFANGTWSYGGWENAFFMPKPCMLKYDGTVDYYLDPNDYSKKADGSASDAANAAYGGNAMMEWGQNGQKIWYKIVPDTDDPTSANVYIANYQADENYHAWSFINNQGAMVDHFYTPIYNGTLDGDGRLRSISGVTYADYCKSKTAAEEIAAAELNNPGSDKLWYTETFADVTLIQLLTVLITKSLNPKETIGEGAYDLGSEESLMLATGSMDDKGLFWGGDHTVGVKCFGMENFWGNQMRRFAGLVFASGYKYKLTSGTEDGSSASGYNTTGEGYLDSGYGSGGFDGLIDKQSFNGSAMFMTGAYEGEDESYLGAYGSYGAAGGKLAGGASYAFRGGSVGDGAGVCGLFSLRLDRGAALAGWNVGAAPSCKPLS